MDSENYKETLYPRLDKATAPSYSSNYRLQYILDIKNYLEHHKELRRKLRKRYTKLYNALHYTNYGLNFVSTGAAVGSVSALTTVVLAPVSIALGSVSITCGALSLFLSALNQKFKKKQDKHRDICNLAEAKLTTIESLISKSLQNNDISHDEFQLILEEEKLFNQLKNKIRLTHHEKFYNEEELKEKGKNELKDSFKRLLSK